MQIINALVHDLYLSPDMRGFDDLTHLGRDLFIGELGIDLLHGIVHFL